MLKCFRLNYIIHPHLFQSKKVTEFGKITRGPKTLSEGNVLILSLELEQIDIFKH